VLSRLPWLVVLLCVAALAGCYGQTELATDIGVSSATLNGQGTTDDGPADVWFEHWPSAAPANVSRTPERRIPGGVSAPFSERIAGLSDGAAYGFRLCGRDVGETQAVCAQTRSLVAGRVNVQAWGRATSFDSFSILDLDADAFAADGGHVFLTYFTGRGGSLATGSHADGNVTCISADGDSAVVAFETGYPSSGPQIARLELFDRGPAGSGADRLSFGFTEDLDDCSPRASYENALTVHGDVAISVP
jgi:hypothetical protein